MNTTDNTTEQQLQDRAGKLVSREVYAHVGGLIEELNDATGGQYFTDHFMPYFTRKDVERYWTDNNTPEADRDENSAIDELYEGYQPMEYWAVSNWLMDKLKDRGEVVVEIGLTNVWARQTSGQAIAIDYVIEQIVKDTEYAKYGGK